MSAMQRLVLVLAMAIALGGRAGAQRGAAPGSHVIIPSLADANSSDDLNFEAGECDVSGDGRTMTCEFQQVFLTPAAFDAQTCLVTTNRYDRTFQQQTANEWVSRDGPSGACAVTEVTTLRHDGGAMWIMETRKVAGNRTSAECRAFDPPPEILSWRNVRRPLACRFVQPGAMSR